MMRKRGTSTREVRRWSGVLKDMLDRVPRAPPRSVLALRVAGRGLGWGCSRIVAHGELADAVVLEGKSQRLSGSWRFRDGNLSSHEMPGSKPRHR